MGQERVRHLVHKYRSSYWQPTQAMRAAGFQTVKLMGTPGQIIGQAEALNDRWDAYRNGGIGIAQAMPGTIAALRLQYTGRYDKKRREWTHEPSPEFALLGKRTRRDYNQWLDAIDEDFGDLPPAALDAKTVKDNYNATVEARGAYAGFHLMGVFRTFLAWCMSESVLDRNVASDVKVHMPAPRDVRWTPEQRDRMIVQGVEMDRRSISLAVLAADWIAQRPFDVRKLMWPNYDGQRIVGIKQKKTDTVLAPMPVSPELKLMLDETPKTSVYIIVYEETGRPYAESTFQHEFRKVARAAGLPDHLKLADFRRTAATEIAGDSATDDELRTITGHKDRNVVARYALPSASSADNAMRKRLQGRQERAKKAAASAAVELDGVGK